MFRIAIRLSLIAFLLSTGPLCAEGRKLAVVVGVGSYRTNSGLPSLGKAPTNDAASLSGVLRQQGFTVFEMTHEAAKVDGQETMAPSIAYIRDQIDGMLGFPNLGADDAILITLHGHGVQFEETDDAGTKTAKFYFCPADATITDIKTANELTERNHLLPLEELYGKLKNCKAATKLLIVDACRNDPNQPGTFRSGLASATLPKLPPPTGGTAAFFSCKPNEQAVQDTEQGQGIFTRYLVQGLQGAADLPFANEPADGIITFAELSAYVANNTYAHVYKTYKVRQSPELRGDYDLNLPLSRVLNLIVGTKAGELREFAGELKVKMCWCPSGSFVMGSPASEADRFDDEDQVNVTLSRGFWLGQTEVAQGLWESVMGTTPWSGEEYVKEGASYPAVYISHGLGADGTVEKDSATEFCRKLTARERAAGRLPAGWEYTLPTEAQREYACRAGTKTAYSFGDDASKLGDYAWYEDNAWNVNEEYAHTVGTKKANAWGLFDMHGNVYEWCQDWYEDKLPGGRDPLAASGGSLRVSRGGGWFYSAGGCRSASRSWDDPSSRSHFLGFRLVLSPSGQ
ncbi:MAG: SUMF1/EgtB/PvdO family nonheme iron enzyme [Planctomycetaceae bacterium]